ncbi:STAS domain-containing protein [Kitasatospora sp. NPDC006697]|uniref:STAS domain-containing protein n=1 Tax=Kitasatospora sp. NPDC006697 TaxID=3364020 RepID=UPI0036CF703E
MSTHDTYPLAPEPPLRIATRRGSGATVVALAGEVDQDQRELLRTHLAGALDVESSCLVLDLAELRFCDSSGLNAFLQTRLEAEARGVALVLANPTPHVRRLLELTGAEQVFTIRSGARES